VLELGIQDPTGGKKGLGDTENDGISGTKSGKTTKKQTKSGVTFFNLLRTNRAFFESIYTWFKNNNVHLINSSYSSNAERQDKIKSRLIYISEAGVFSH